MIKKEQQEDLMSLFEPDLFREILNRSVFKTANVGDTIIEIGQNITHFPFILSGSMKISRIDPEGNEIFLYYLNSFDSCAMSFTCCIQHTPSEIVAKAEEKIEYLAIPLSEMELWFSKYSTWKNFVMSTIRNRFNELLKTIDQIAFQKLDDRLVHYLKERSKMTGSKLINLTHEQIASDLATSRVVISRLLKKLENDSRLNLNRNQIKLLGEL